MPATIDRRTLGTWSVLGSATHSNFSLLHKASLARRLQATGSVGRFLQRRGSISPRCSQAAVAGMAPYCRSPAMGSLVVIRVKSAIKLPSNSLDFVNSTEHGETECSAGSEFDNRLYAGISTKSLAESQQDLHWAEKAYSTSFVRGWASNLCNGNRTGRSRACTATGSGRSTPKAALARSPPRGAR